MKKRVQGLIDGQVFDEFKAMCEKEGLTQADGYQIALEHFLDDLTKDQRELAILNSNKSTKQKYK